jgi:MFS family permease
MQVGALLQNRWVRILGVAFVMHLLAFIDRNNIAMAIPAMRTSLDLSAASIGFASGSLYITYIILQIPAGRLAETWSAKKIILISAILWGLASLSTAFVRNGTELIINRLIMGLVEGGETVTLIILVRSWFTRVERARALTVILISLPLASVTSSLISGFILERLGWQWMFVIEAVPTLIWAGVWQLAVCDRPEQAKWLPADVQRDLVARLREEEQEIKPLPGHWLGALWHPAILLLALNNLLFLTGNLGVVLWLPSVLKETGISITEVGTLSAMTYVAGAVMMILCSTTSDYFQERKWHIIVLNLLAGIFLLLVPKSGQSAVVWTVVCFAFINGLLYGRFALFWAFPSEILPASVVGVGVGLINCVGSFGGFLGPYIFGYVRGRTDDFGLALTLAAGMLVLAGLLIIPIKPLKSKRARGGVIPLAPALNTNNELGRL